ncbi:hypothetical protein SAMN05428959_10822 [Duganella sp. CF517]|uniref:hypothetical protein n=1 Tax=Duganella sp. CF517 TaxID=1881038 RepID=UPI0008B64F28|nr:hypothetical protein [Duganella sp. CF517]SEO43913.1 hypothetical protein SAMN05428959_10822 [Duganella sp. CF517]
MSAPVEIKPAAPKRQRRAAKPQAVPAAEFGALEIRAALAVRRLPADRKQSWCEMLERLATKLEADAAAARPAPVLRLISGGAR